MCRVLHRPIANRVAMPIPTTMRTRAPGGSLGVRVLGVSDRLSGPIGAPTAIAAMAIAAGRRGSGGRGTRTATNEQEILRSIVAPVLLD
jgi:hypothetical protein